MNTSIDIRSQNANMRTDLSWSMSTPPLVCIEILSPGESTLAILRKVSEYLEFGVAAVWVIDPAKQQVMRYDQDGLHYPDNKTLTLPESGISIDFRPLFQELNQA